MTKITNRMITDRWIEAFEGEKPYTPSELRMMGIKLSQLRKNIKKHLEATNNQTTLSIEQIIMDAIEYSVMLNKPYRSIASIGYEILDPSIGYWEKRRKLEELKQQELPVDKTEVNVELPIQKNISKSSSPEWLNADQW